MSLYKLVTLELDEFNAEETKDEDNFQTKSFFKNLDSLYANSWRYIICVGYVLGI